MTKREVCLSALDQAQARLAKAREEIAFFEVQQSRLAVRSPVGGVIMTPRLKERKGQYLKEGDLICTIEEPNDLRAEVRLAEQGVSKVRPGQHVESKARSLPFDRITGEVDRAAPGAVMPLPTETPAKNETAVIVYCRLDGEYAELRPGMTGFARI